MSEIAIIVYGEYREFDIAFKSWRFFDELNCDYYFSTWDKSIQKHKELNFYLEEVITEEKIKEKIPDCHISIMDYNSNKLHNCDTIGFHWNNGIETIENKNKKYDILILCRTDNFMLFTQNPKNLYNLNEKNVIYGLGDENQIQDIFLMGDFETLKKFVILLPKDIYKLEHKMGIGIHDVLKKHIEFLNLKHKNIEGLFVSTARPTLRTVENINLSVVLEHATKWGPNVYQWI